MKILISKPEGIVLQLNVVSVNEDNAQGEGWVDATVNSSNSEIVEAESAPSTWQRGCYVYSNGTWSFLDTEAENTIVTSAANKLTATKERIVAEIKVERDRRKLNGVYVSGKWIHSDTYSRTQWMAMVMMGANIPAIAWTTMDNSTVTTSQTLAGAVFQATANLDATLFAYAKSLISAVDASSAPESIDITTGWPVTFGEDA